MIQKQGKRALAKCSVRSWFKSHYIQLIAIAILLSPTIYVGFLYFDLGPKAENELQERTAVLSRDGFFVTDFSLANMPLHNISEIQDFSRFVDYAKKENASMIWVDRQERLLYFSSELLTGLIGFRYMQLSFDFGGFFAFLIALIIIFAFNLPANLYDRLKQNKAKFKSSIYFLIIGAGVIGIWLSVRIILLYIFRYFFVEGFQYEATDVLSILSYILVANLPFTLFKALTMGEGEEQQNDVTILKGLMGVLIQASVIGLLAFMPTYNNANLFLLVGGYIGYIAIILTFIVSIVILVVARNTLGNHR